ncbi:MAG TPA: aminotransferase class I/II-fold pyridoxal phosphate-dependent enzyme [Polyangiales bacterium]|nr:aminotransferase class I/II-fold pyridoxal phosphate-dependent enzyme [Polyangiales bacterium]
MHDGQPAALRVHGGVHRAELRALALQPEQVLDFSVNVNAYGPAPSVLRAIAGAPIDRYPDPRAERACDALGASLGEPRERVLLGHGAAELLWSAARSLLAPGSSALIVEPTFCELRAAALACGARVLEWRARAEHGFAIDLIAVRAAAERAGARAIYLCAPNTPTGTAVPAAEIAAVAASLPEVSWIVDQSFLSLSERFADAAVAQPSNVLRVCSLTKDHAIPGLRVGYAIGNPALLQRMEAERFAWCTSAPAQAAAEAAATAGSFVAQSRSRLLADAAHLAAALRALGLHPLPSSTAFMLVELPAAIGTAAALRARLLERQRVLVRDCASFGLPRHMRIAARPAADCARLIAALEEEL